MFSKHNYFAEISFSRYTEQTLTTIDEVIELFLPRKFYIIITDWLQTMCKELCVIWSNIEFKLL